jgi:hypothetical protein
VEISMVITGPDTHVVLRAANTPASANPDGRTEMLSNGFKDLSD